MNGQPKKDAEKQPSAIHAMVGWVWAIVSDTSSRIVGPARAASIMDAFNRQHPLVRSLIVAWALFAGPPIALYIGFVISCFAFALLAACTFVAFWAGLALLVLIPAVMFMTGVSLFFWFWGTVAFRSFAILRGLVQQSGPSKPANTVTVKEEPKEKVPTFKVYRGITNSEGVETADGQDSEGIHGSKNGDAAGLEVAGSEDQL